MMTVRSTWGRLRSRYGGYIFWVAYGTLALFVALAGGTAGMIFGHALNLPRVEELAEIRPGTVTHIRAHDERVIGQFALEKRILIRYREIPPRIKQAVLAWEDAKFFEHAGIDFRRVFITLAYNILRWERKGASTITMQLSKLRFTSYERTWQRKILDGLHALEIEKRYSKEEIFTFYFNQVYMGHGIYGIATAADFYFSKPVSELTLSESALLAGIIKWPPRFSPINNMALSKQRRNLVLGRMNAEGYIDEKTLEEAVQEPVVLNVRREKNNAAPYVVESVRQELALKYETEEIWNRGLEIQTTIDFDVQAAANQAIREGLKNFDKEKNEWTGAPQNVLNGDKPLDDYRHPEWRRIFYPGQLIHGLVLESGPESATVRLGSFTAEIGPEQIAWTKKKKVDQALAKGDVAVFRLDKIDRDRRTIEAVLDRIPEVQGAFVAVENSTGAILAVVGGFDFEYSEFNRATQALRQPGSIFKPFTYVAALENGWSPFDAEMDEPVNFYDALGRLYSPENSDEKFKGVIPLYQALAESRNVPTIRLAQKVGIEKIIAVANRFGIDREFLPVLPMAIGAGELTLLEITSAFSAFANNGVHASPYLIKRVRDYDGTLLQEHRRNEVTEVISPEIASQMLYLLRQVVEIGTARRAKVLGRPIAGKTGTTNDYTDSWFVGITPRFTAGVWVGHETKKTLGEKVYGNNLALPIWIDFFRQIEDRFPPEDFDGVYSPTPLDLAKVARIPRVRDGEPQEPKAGGRSESGLKVENIPPPKSRNR